MKTAAEHNKKILAQWEAEANSQNAKVWAGITIDEKWSVKIHFVNVQGIDLAKELRKIADILDQEKKKGGHA